MDSNIFDGIWHLYLGVVNFWSHDSRLHQLVLRAAVRPLIFIQSLIFTIVSSRVVRVISCSRWTLLVYDVFIAWSSAYPWISRLWDTLSDIVLAQTDYKQGLVQLPRGTEKVSCFLDEYDFPTLAMNSRGHRYEAKQSDSLSVIPNITLVTSSIIAWSTVSNEAFKLIHSITVTCWTSIYYTGCHSLSFIALSHMNGFDGTLADSPDIDETWCNDHWIWRERVSRGPLRGISG